MATIETKYNIGQEVWVISIENRGPEIKKRIVSGITVETIDISSYEHLRNEPIVTYAGFNYRVYKDIFSHNFGKRKLVQGYVFDDTNARFIPETCVYDKKEEAIVKFIQLFIDNSIKIESVDRNHINIYFDNDERKDLPAVVEDEKKDEKKEEVDDDEMLTDEDFTI